MAPYVVVERLEGKQERSSAAVRRNPAQAWRARRNPSPRMTKVTVHEKREVNEKRPNPHNSPSHNHDSAAHIQHPLI